MRAAAESTFFCFSLRESEFTRGGPPNSLLGGRPVASGLPRDNLVDYKRTTNREQQQQQHIQHDHFGRKSFAK